MNFSPNAVALVKQSEGLVLKVYADPGTGGAPWTAGYGHTGADVRAGMTVTLAMALAWLQADLSSAAATVSAHVTVPLNQNQFDALCDFVFNEGADNFIGSTLLRLLNGGRYGDAANQLDRWNLSNGRVMPGLVTRRAAEKSLFNKPICAN